MTSRSKDQKPDAVSLTKRRPQAFAKFNPPAFFDPPQGDPAPSGTPQNLLSKRVERKTPLSLPFAKSSGAFFPYSFFSS